MCKSVLWTEFGETGLVFEDCVVGGTYYKDFSIWNHSEIELYWLLNTVDLNHKSSQASEMPLIFTDYSTGESFDWKAPIPAYSQVRIRVTFKPLEVGEFNYDLQVLS